MAHESQINSVIVKINMDSTENDPRFVVEEVTTQPGFCFEGVENLHRARFECLCCKTGYVVLPLITQTALIQTIMVVSIAENDPTPIQQVVEHVSEDETGSFLDEAVDLDEKQKQDDEFDDVKMEAELFEIAPLDNQGRVEQMTDLEEGDFGRTLSDRLLHEVVNSNEGDGHEDSKMEATITFPMDVDADSVEMPSVEHQALVGQTSDTEESDVLTLSEERSLKLQCMRSKVVIRLVRVDEEAREKDVPVAPIETQKQNIEGGFYTCDICKASIKYRGNLTCHMNIHMGIRFSCSECPKSFSEKSSLSRHKKSFHQSEFRICEVCKRGNTCTKAEYNSHLRRRHPEFINECRQKAQNFNGVDFLCIYCEPQATFKSFRELKDHLSVTHDWKFVCTRCPKAFNEKNNLNDHIESTHKKKTFSCPRCDKIFMQKTSLYAHLHIHK